MPRVTRATLRSNAASESSDLLPSTSLRQRAPLGETAGNVGKDSRVADRSGQMTRARKRGQVKVKKGNAAKIASAGLLESSEDCAEILEDDNQSVTSPAVEEACDDLMKHGSSGTFRIWL